MSHIMYIPVSEVPVFMLVVVLPMLTGVGKAVETAIGVEVVVRILQFTGP